MSPVIHRLLLELLVKSLNDTIRKSKAYLTIDPFPCENQILLICAQG